MSSTFFVRYPDLGANEYRIPEYNVEKLLSDLAKLGRRADKIGVTRPGVQELRREVLEVWEHNLDFTPATRKTDQVRGFRIYTPTGTEVRMDGWHFVATIQHIGEDGNLIRTVPSFMGNLPTSYRTDYPTCDHCHTRRPRLETFVVQHESGEFKRIGRNCIKDYLGEESASRILAAASFDDAMRAMMSDNFGDGLGDGFGGFGGGIKQARPSVVLAWTVATIRTHGWLSRGVARQCEDKQATADVVWDHLFPPMKFRPTVGKPTDEQIAEAEAALTWALAINPDTDSDYLHNCRVVAGLHVWMADSIGIGASIVAAYQREQDRLALQRFATRLPSVYLASEGTKFGGKAKGNQAPFAATVIHTRELESDYGMVEMVKLLVEVDAEHVADLLWFASGGAGAEGKRLERGQKVIVAAAGVKRCQVNNKSGRQETVLTRCTLYAYSEEKMAELMADHEAVNAPKKARGKKAA